MGSRDGACRGDGGADEVGLVVPLAHALPPLEHLVTARAGATVRVRVRVRFRVEVRVRFRVEVRVSLRLRFRVRVRVRVRGAARAPPLALPPAAPGTRVG